ncbi:putative recombination initiation defects 3 [Primulina tabacum]|uniref:putative recombination initiation defects 3 n=2 Tax=Primulina tabacum TaxID=48773 RepID=UPI003F5AC2EB
MKMKINKACDLSSISVLPPQSRRSVAVHNGSESSSIFGRNRAASDLRPQQSQQSLSQGISSQHGLFSQFSQNSQDEILTSEKIGSQERENSLKRTSCLPPINCTREETQMMMIPKTSSTLIRKWTGQDYKCQISEELEHRIGMVETSLSRLGMILDSVQSDIMQGNKGTKEVALEMEGVRQKLIALDDSMLLMSKGQEDIKTRLDLGLTSVSDRIKQSKSNQENYREIFSMLSSLSEKIDTQMTKLQHNLFKNFSKDMQAIACNMKKFIQLQETPPIHGREAAKVCATMQEVFFPNDATMHVKAQQAYLLPKDEMGRWTSVKPKQATFEVGNCNNIINQEREWRVLIESDEELDGGFSCLLKEKGRDNEEYSSEAVEEETARILRNARKRKRKHSNTIIIN